MTRKEYDQKSRELLNSMGKLDEELRKLCKDYCSHIEKLNGLKPGIIIEDTRGVKYVFEKVTKTYGLVVVGRRIKKDGTPHARTCIVWGYKLKEE